MNDWKVWEGDISSALDEGWFPVADFGEDPSGKNYCIVSKSDDMTAGQAAAEFQRMQDRIKELESQAKQGALF